MKRDNIEVLLVGARGSGKTALMRHIDREPFTEDLEHTINPMSLNPRPTANEPSPSIPLHVSDTSSQFQHRADKSYLSIRPNTDAVVICFDRTDKDSFERAKGIYQDIQMNRPEMNNIVLAATKVDLPRGNDGVAESDILKFVYGTEDKLQYVPCSAKTGQGADRVFETAKSQVLDSRAPKMEVAPAAIPLEKTEKATKQTTKRRFGWRAEVVSSPSPTEPKAQKPEVHASEKRTLEVVLSNLNLSKEQKAKFPGGRNYSDAFLLAQTAILNSENFAAANSFSTLDSGAKIFAYTARLGRDDKIAIKVEYNDQNAAATMAEMADRISMVALTQRDPLEIRTSHDDTKLLAKALDKKSLAVGEEVYRVSIDNLREDLNKYGAPALFYNTDASKKIVQDRETHELKSLEQQIVTPDGKGVITARANYLAPNPNDTKEYRLANEIQVEIRPSSGQFLTSNTMSEFRTVVQDMNRGGRVTIDPTNPSELNGLLAPLAPAQQAAPVIAQPQAVAERAAPAQEEKATKRASRLPRDFKLALQRQHSIGELESFSPRENTSHETSASLLTQAAFEFDKKVELNVESSGAINTSSLATQFAHEQGADLEAVSIDQHRSLLSDKQGDFLIDVTRDKNDSNTLHVTVDCRDTDAAENRVSNILSNLTSSASLQAQRVEVKQDDTAKVAQSIQEKNPKIEVTQAQSATAHK